MEVCCRLFIDKRLTSFWLLCRHYSIFQSIQMLSNCPHCQSHLLLHLILAWL